MKSSLSRALGLTMVFLASTGLVHAHPGHDGHELTWDFSHLAAFPVATVTCFVFVVGAVWGGWLFLRRAATQRVQSLRVPQRSREK